jgi:Calcineurin-like phosphoesterase
VPIHRAFGDPNLTPDNFSSFSKQEISADSAIKGIEKLQPIPTPRSTAPMDLSTVIGVDATQKIQNSGQIVFHTVGDTGGVHSPEFQFAVADAMAADSASGACFWFHLGDVVYYFGQDQYYFEQFYDPYRDYNAPIFAIPGNHDAVIFNAENAKTLDAFIANFCSSQPANSPDSQGAVRTTMDQPGVYFTLNAPFVKFIGLYSNTGEGGTQGVIANSKIGNAQLDFLGQELATARAERANGQGRALIIATHHPPFTGSPFHIPSPDMLQQIDQACTAAGIWPDLHLSGHSHLYERYTRTVNGKQIPYVVAGVGGFYNLAGLKSGKKPTAPTTPASGTDAVGNPLTMNVYNDTNFGFLRLTVSPDLIVGEFVTVDPTSRKIGLGDSFTLDLLASKVSGAVSAKKRSSSKAGAKLGHLPKSKSSPGSNSKSRTSPKRSSKITTTRPKSKEGSTHARAKKKTRSKN